MPCIFTTNSQLTEEDHIFPRGRNAKQQHAIDRRYRKIGPLTEPLQRLGRKLKTGRAQRLSPSAGPEFLLGGGSLMRKVISTAA